MERLQRVLATSGVASRRKAEELIREGRVTVDGRVVREMGVQVDPGRQRIAVDGRPIRHERRRYLMLNKPVGYITTMSDERGRYTVMDLVDVPERVVPVGRLDRATSGLLLLTNDGELLYRVTHPRFELEKEYEALVDGHPPREAIEQLQHGVTVDGQRVVPTAVWPARNEEAGTVLHITIHEGRNRIVRRMLERIGYPVIKLARIRVGPLQVRGLPVGAWRDLTPGELAQLFEAVGMAEEERRRPRPAPVPPRGGRPPSAPGRAPRRRPGAGQPERGRQPGRPGRSDSDGGGAGMPPAGGSRRRSGGGREEHRGGGSRPSH